MNDGDLSLLMTVTSEAEAGMIADLLGQSSIQCVLRDNGIGSAYLGSSNLYGIDVLVAPQELDQAADMVAALLSPPEDAFDYENNTDEDTEETDNH